LQRLGADKEPEQVVRVYEEKRTGEFGCEQACEVQVMVLKQIGR
jgi:hypothetical protein